VFRWGLVVLALASLIPLWGTWATAADEPSRSPAQAVADDGDGGGARDQQQGRSEWWRQRRRGARHEYTHKESGQRFLSPRGWQWHDPPRHFTVNKLCYPADAEGSFLLPNAILRIKPLDRGVTFPMIVDYAEYRLRKLLSVKEVVQDEPVEMPFGNQGAHVLHVRGQVQGVDVECRQIVYLRGQWFTVIACGSKPEDFEQYGVYWQELLDSISLVEPSQ